MREMLAKAALDRRPRNTWHLAVSLPALLECDLCPLPCGAQVLQNFLHLLPPQTKSRLNPTMSQDGIEGIDVRIDKAGSRSSLYQRPQSTRRTVAHLPNHKSNETQKSCPPLNLCSA